MLMQASQGWSFADAPAAAEVAGFQFEAAANRASPSKRRRNITCRQAALPLDVLLFRDLGRRALRSGDPNLVAVGEAVRRRDDDAVVRREARAQFDVPAEVAGDGHGLEQHLV